jgi:hypothetical protein
MASRAIYRHDCSLEGKGGFWDVSRKPDGRCILLFEDARQTEVYVILAALRLAEKRGISRAAQLIRSQM